MRIDRRGFIVTFGLTTLAACGNNGSGSTTQQQPSSNQGGAGGTGGGSGTAAGSTPLTLDFSGLIALARPSNGSDPLDVLLVDGNATIGEPHDPLLVIEKALVASTTTPGTDRIYKARMCTFWSLKDAQLTIDSSGSGISAVTNHRQPGHDKPSAGEEDDVSWMPEMSKIPGVGAGRINPVCLAADPRPAYVSARVHCTSGDLKSRFAPIWKDRVFRFQNGGSTYAQALGMPQLTIPATQPAVVKLTPFGASTPATTITLTNGAHSIDVLNEPTATPASCKTSDDYSHLTHFVAFYKLLDPSTPPTATPIPECTGANCPVCDPTKPFHQSDYIYCPPAQF